MTKKSKVEMRYCYKCKTKSPKEELTIVNTGKKSKTGGDVIRYYHNECMTVEKVNKSKGERRTGSWNNESDVHKSFKDKLFNMIINKEIKLYDQFGKEIIFKDNSFISTETPVSKEYGKEIPYVSSCKPCLDKFELEYNEEVEKRIDPKVVKSCYNSYKIHPCIGCIFNKQNYISVFDIGAGKDKEYTTAIEVLNTSRVKEYKLKYCIKNNIELFEVNVNDIEDELDDTLVLQRLWWIDNKGKIIIHKDYI
ncbi:hypothetical protein [uncultured Metabacillus sp.]|uniref:hypothetical protein n=1 Tax=uncultured Metabacillus sp. TaxID=2860135 RepID=UPI002625C8B6|nr:hypothetical protein [uncultured Metabacillus sp.]